SGAADPPDGLLVVDKPSGWTSHDVVGRVRRLAGTRKVGHAGTLDPMATGVLVLGVGRATRLLTYLVGADKEYTATVRLGQTTVTDDAEGEVTASRGAAEVDPDALQRALAGLRGPIDQVPSAVSAIKVGGQRSYARVRGGEQVELAARPVVIHRFDVLAHRATTAADGTAVTDLDVVVGCSSGTYVRALARDLCAALGTGGHLTALRRTHVGPFHLAAAAALADLRRAPARRPPILPSSVSRTSRAAPSRCSRSPSPADRPSRCGTSRRRRRRRCATASASRQPGRRDPSPSPLRTGTSSHSSRTAASTPVRS